MPIVKHIERQETNINKEMVSKINIENMVNITIFAKCTHSINLCITFESLDTLSQIPLECVWIEYFNEAIHFFEEFRFLCNEMLCLDREIKKHFKC